MFTYLCIAHTTTLSNPFNLISLITEEGNYWPWHRRVTSVRRQTQNRLIRFFRRTAFSKIIIIITVLVIIITVIKLLSLFLGVLILQPPPSSTVHRTMQRLQQHPSVAQLWSGVLSPFTTAGTGLYLLHKKIYAFVGVDLIVRYLWRRRLCCSLHSLLYIITHVLQGYTIHWINADKRSELGTILRPISLSIFKWVDVMITPHGHTVILLGLALYLPSASVSLVLMVLYRY